MPQYQISVPGKGTFRVDSPTELTDLQAWQAVQSQLAAGPSKERTVGEAAKDIAASVVSGAGSLVQLPGQLYGLATGNFADTGALGLGKDIRQYGEEMKSAGLKARESERAEKIKTAEQKGQWEAFKTAFGETVKDPALLTSFLAEQAPQLLVPFGAAKVAQVGTAAKAAAAAQGLTGTAAKEAVEAVTKEAAKRGTAAAVGAGAVQQGADVGAQAYEDIYKELVSKGATDADAAQGAINLARAAGASGTLISLLAQRLPGAKTLEETFAGVRGPGGRLVGAARGALGEGASEIVEETGGKFGANLAMREVKPEQSLLEGLGATAGMAAIGGVGMGGVSGALQRPGEKIEIINGKKFVDGKPVEEEVPPVAPLVSPEPEKPMITRVMDMASQQNGYGLLEQQKQRLLAEPQTEDIKKELTFIQEIQDRMNIETAQRLTPSGKSPFTITPDALTELGIKPTAPIIKRINGKAYDDPYVIEQLEKFAANKNVAPEVQQSVLAFVEQLRQPVEPPAAPVSEAPTAEPVAPTVTPPSPSVEPVAEAVEPPAPPVAPPAEPPAPPVEPAPVVEAAAPAEKPTFEPKIVSRLSGADGMEVHVFTTTDGYGTGLFDADAQQYVNGSITRFAGADTLPKAQERAAEMFQKATPPAERPAGETAVPVLSDFQKRLKDYWDNTATPAIRNYLSAINSFGIDRLEKSQIKPTGMSVREWIESFVSKQSTWDKGRKTGETGIQALSTKNLWPTTDGSGERLRKAMLDAVKALKNAPGSTSELVDQAFGESKSTTTAAPKADAPVTPVANVEEQTTPTEEAKDIAEPTIRNRLKAIAKNLGVWVFETGDKYSSGKGIVNIPTEDKQVEGAQSPEHVFAHELGHAILQNRSMSFNGMPNAEVAKWIDGWDGIKAISKAFRPEIHTHKLPKFRRHANKPDEIIADALGSFLLGISSKQDIAPLIKALNLNDFDLGIKARTVAAPKAEAPAVEAPAPAAEMPSQEPLVTTSKTEQTLLVEATNTLSQEEQSALENHYGGSLKSAEVQSRVVNDVLAYINKGAKSVAESVRKIIGKLSKALLSVAVFFSASGINPQINTEAYARTVASMPAQVTVSQAEQRESKKADTSGRKLSPNAQRVADWIAENAEANEISQILDPATGMMYVMKGGKIVADSPALFGKAGVGAIDAQILGKPAAKMTETDKVTPAGRFALKLEQDETYGTTLTFLPTKDGGGYAIHRVYLGNPTERRTERLNSQDASDNSVSYGCVNVSNEFYDQTLRQFDYSGKAFAYLLPSDASKLNQFFDLNNKADVDNKFLYSVEPTIKSDRVPSYKRGVENLRKRWEKGDLTSDEFAGRVDILAKQVEMAELAKEKSRRERGADFLRQRLLEAKRRGELSPEAVDFAEWFILQNPALVDDLGISIRTPKEDGVGGMYSSYGRVMYLMKERGSDQTVVHEILHHLERMMPKEVQSAIRKTWIKSLMEAQKNAKTDAEKQFFKNLTDFHFGFGARSLMKSAIDAIKDGDVSKDLYQYTSPSEFWAENGSEIMRGRFDVKGSVLGRLKQWLSELKEKARSLFGLENKAAIIRALDSLSKGDGKFVTSNLLDETTEPKFSITPTGTPGQKALETIRSMGMDVPKPDPTKLEKAKDIWKKAKEDPKLTAQSALKAARDFMDKVETWAFSPDAKLNNDFRRAVIKDFKENEGVLGQLLEMSQSQAVHADALSSQFLIDGGLKYNDKVQKWESFESKANFPALSKKLDEIGEKYGLNKEQIERVAHAYLVAKRLPGLIERNKNLDAEIAAEQASIKPDKKKIKDLEDKKVFISEKQLEQIEPGLSLVKDIPELNQVVDMWNEIRKNTIDVMVNSGLWSPEYAQQMWDNMDYVPYFRDDQIENEAGPQEFIRGLQVKSKEFQLKGSEDAVHDVFDNMIRWTQYAINRSVRAHKALQMIDNAKDIQIGDRKMAEKVTEEKRGMNIARVFCDGKQELYDMADPMYVQAFSAIQNVSIPTIKFMAQVSNVLRQSVVLYPLFSVAQVPQDAFAAMFTSGLKTQHALKIPYLAVKEFIKTLNKTSATHNTLKKFGATGVRDFSATVIRDDAEIYAGLKPPRGGWGKTKEFLSHISMAADNAVRQAVYEASMQQGVKQSEAIEKAFDVINFRRKGTSKMLNILGQTVPFFYAYLSAQRVALKVLTGTGISPTDRKEAFQTLATTSAAVATLSLLYAMANGDDEDYMETPANIRDRTLTIPGSGGVRIPLRPDFFLFPKIVAEHTYLMLSDQGYQDGAKFRTSMKDALFSAVASPTPFPTAIKPAIEVAINYDFFQGKPLIGNFEKEKALERQFRDSTSEFAKLLGATGMVSPIAADHMIRGMFGSFGGLFLYGTNQFLHSDPDVPRPELSANEMLTALPGTSGLLKRPQESALKNDFYTLRDEVEKAVNTFNDIKTRSPQGMEDFLADEKQMARYMLGKPVDQINRQLSKIRRQMTIITNMPESQMSAEDKAENIRQLREFEREYLKSVDVKALREMAKI